VTAAFTAAERRDLEHALRHDQPLACPYCRTALVVRPVEASPEVAYVRHRVWVMCPACHRTAGLDDRPRP
jgi:hypothetical protein